MRDEIQKCKSLGGVIRVVNRYIFDKDHDGEVDEIVVTPGWFQLRLIRILSMVTHHSYPVRNMSGMARGGVYSRSLPPPRALFSVAGIAQLRQRPRRKKPVHQSTHSPSQICISGTLERILWRASWAVGWGLRSHQRHTKNRQRNWFIAGGVFRSSWF